MLALFITWVRTSSKLADEIVNSLLETDDSEDQEERRWLLGPLWSLVGHGQLLLLVLDDVDVDGGGGDVVRQAPVLPGGVLVDLLYGEDRLGDEPHVGGEGVGVAGGEEGPVLPHHELRRPQHVAGQTLQLQGAAWVDQQGGTAQDVDLKYRDVISKFLYSVSFCNTWLRYKSDQSDWHG